MRRRPAKRAPKLPVSSQPLASAEAPSPAMTRTPPAAAAAAAPPLYIAMDARDNVAIVANGDGSVGTRNLLAITTTVQCVAGVVEGAVQRIRAELLQRCPHVDGVAQLTARAATPEIAQAIVREMAWYDAYLQRGNVDRSANTTPGNKKGGLSNIVEKAMGSIVKSGSSRIDGVLAPGEKLKQKGLVYAATPASDFICGTLQLAAGINLHVFTTGRGTPYGLAEVPRPVVKTCRFMPAASCSVPQMKSLAGVAA